MMNGVLWHSNNQSKTVSVDFLLIFATAM